MRAHGAWVYLIVSVLAGALTAASHGRLAAVLAGGGFAGVFVLGSTVAITDRRALLVRIASGTALTIGAPLLALAAGGNGSFLLAALLAAPAAAGALALGRRRGFLSPGVLALAVVALTAAAPVAATAGGVRWPWALLLMALVAPFFGWRSWRLARALGRGWTRRRLRRRGLAESAWAAGWVALAVLMLAALGA